MVERLERKARRTQQQRGGKENLSSSEKEKKVESIFDRPRKRGNHAQRGAGKGGGPTG